jgi:hypothetical protein
VRLGRIPRSSLEFSSRPSFGLVGDGCRFVRSATEMAKLCKSLVVYVALGRIVRQSRLGFPSRATYVDLYQAAHKWEKSLSNCWFMCALVGFCGLEVRVPMTGKFRSVRCRDLDMTTDRNLV